MSEVRATHDSIECGLRWREFRIPDAVRLNKVEMRRTWYFVRCRLKVTNELANERVSGSNKCETNESGRDFVVKR